MYEGVISSLIGAAFIAAIGYIFNSYVREPATSKIEIWKNHFHLRSKPEKYFIRFLRKDLDNVPPHRGQFGKKSRPEEDSAYTVENLSTKPRMHFTGEVTKILLKHNLLTESEKKRIRDGIQELLHNDWLPIFLGASKNTHTDRAKRIVSFRHTIRAAHILALLAPENPISKNTLARMLDEELDMQCPNGGWRQCQTEFTSEDMWATAYAIDFLHHCFLNPFYSSNKNEIKEKIVSSIGWLEQQWELNKWALGEDSPEDLIPAEENASLLFQVVYDTYFHFDKNKITSKMAFFDGLVDKVFNPSDIYLEKLSHVGVYSASMRLSYVFFKAKGLSSRYVEMYKSLTRYALRNLDGNINCIDASQSLDILLATETSTNELVVNRQTP